MREDYKDTYSARKARTGLMVAARRAGTRLATSAHNARAATDPPNATGSHPFTS